MDNIQRKRIAEAVRSIRTSLDMGRVDFATATGLLGRDIMLIENELLSDEDTMRVVIAIEKRFNEVLR